MVMLRLRACSRIRCKSGIAVCGLVFAIGSLATPVVVALVSLDLVSLAGQGQGTGDGKKEGDQKDMFHD